MSKWHPAATAGVALGLLYIFEGLFDTGILFAVWPILGGIFAAALTRWSADRALTPAGGARAGAGAGLIGGMVVLVVGTPLTYWVMRKVGQDPEFFGITFDLPPIVSVAVIYAIYSAAGMLVAAAAGGLTGLLAGRRESRD